MKKFTYLTCLLSASILLAGCETNPPRPDTTAPHPASVTPQKTPTPSTEPAQLVAQSSLNTGIELYNKGDYNNAIKQLLTATEIWSGNNTVIQVEALKYMAFSYCVTGRQTLCKQQFEKALKLDPAFDLAPGEKGHPLWAPVFDRVKKAK